MRAGRVEPGLAVGVQAQSTALCSTRQANEPWLLVVGDWGSAEFGLYLFHFTCFKCVVVRNRLQKSIKFQKSNSSTSVTVL
jgi:hypothetical protein